MPQFSIDEKDRALSCLIPLQPAVKRRVSELEGYMKYHLHKNWCELQEILANRNIVEVVCVILEKVKSVLIIDIEET